MQKKVGSRDFDVSLDGDPFTGGLNPPPPFSLAVAWGLQLPNYERAFGIGFNPDVDTATTPEDAWGSSGLYPWLSTTTSLEAVSTSVNDSAAGTGARTVTFSTLDANYVRVNQTITLNGTTAVALPAAAFRNNGGRCLTAGSLGTNDGDIILRDAGGGTTRGIIQAGKGVMRQAPYTVPAGYTLAIPWIALAVDSPSGAVGKFASINTYFKSPTGAFILPLQIGNTNGVPYNHFSDPPIMVSEKNDFSLRIITASDNNTIVTAGWNGFLRANLQTI